MYQKSCKIDATSVLEKKRRRGKPERRLMQHGAHMGAEMSLNGWQNEAGGNKTEGISRGLYF